MEKHGARSRLRSFDKPRAEAPPRLQVIGFNVSPMKAADHAAAIMRESSEMVSSAPTAASYSDSLAKPAAASPRSALQQLLLHQSLPSTTTTTSSNQCSPPLLPQSSSSQFAAKQSFTAGALLPHDSSPYRNSTSGWLLQPATSSPSAAHQKCTSGGLLPFAANQKWTSGVSRPESPSAANHDQGNSSCSGLLKSLIQSNCATSDISTNQSSCTSFLSSFSQSQCASSSESSAGSQILNQHNAKPAKALMKELSEAFLQIKHTDDDAKAHAGKSKKSNWLLHDDEADDDDHPSAAEKCKKSSWKGVQPITEHSLGNEKSRKGSRIEEKCKKSSLFMLVASSPAPESRHHPHSEEHNAFENMDFLNSCHLCRRFLGLGQDVFMYSGDKAFCTMECRYQQIVIDERKERCPPSIIRSGASPVFHHTSASSTATHHPIMINKPHFINTAAAA